MRIGSRLRSLTFVIILLLLLSGLGMVEAEAETDAGTESMFIGGGGGRQTPRVAKQTPATLPSSTTGTPLPSPSPLTTASPLSPTTPSPDTPSSSTDSPGSADSASTRPSRQTDDQAAHTVRFDPADGSKPTQATVKTGTLAAPPEKNPQREGSRFDGWTLDDQPFDFQTPILQDTTLTARWAKATDWTLSPNHGPASGARLTISPPDKQEPSYTSIHTADSQFIGLTGDGNIYVWTQDGTPKQVPLPAQAPEGFHYLQAAAGSQWQAALGSDQHIYTWTSQQPTPTILDTDRNIRFTSISTSSNRLLAVDQQGRVHNFQASQADSRNMKPTEQSTISLSGQAQAILAVASPSRTLIVDADGQAWSWKPGQAGNTKPSPIMQDQGVRIIQTAALSQGLLLLDADGHTRYLADSTTSAKAVNLPDSKKASRISASNDQAIITDKDGHLWFWKPGETHARADNGKQHYMQAVRIGNEIAALDRRGSLCQWSIDAQGLPSKPTKIDSTTAPTLESASLDGQALTLSKTGDTWQADVPARNPGPAVITITGMQGDKPFTRSLDYTVDQTLTRAVQSGSTYKVSFNTAGGSQAPQPQQVTYPFGRVQRPYPDPTRSGYQFDGWFIGNAAYNFSKPVTDNLTLTAHWTYKDPNNTWRINPDTGSQLGHETTTITPPTSQGIRFNQTSSSRDAFGDFALAVGSDGNAYAWGNNTIGQLGDGTNTNRTKPVKVKKPTGVPASFTYVQVNAGNSHSLAVGSDGYVYAWGNNSHGELGNGSSGGSSNIPVRVMDPNNAGKGLTALQVSGGGEHSLAIDANGKTWSWGINYYGQLGRSANINTYAPNPIPRQVQYPSAAGTLQIMQVSAGTWHSLAVDTNGRIWTWGWNQYGQLGNSTNSGQTSPNPTPMQVDYPYSAGAVEAIQVSAGDEHSLAVDSRGNVWAWGLNQVGQLGNSTNTGSTTANPVPLQVQYPKSAGTGLKTVQVSAGGGHSMAVDSKGNAWAWGLNSPGVLGDNTTTDRHSPIQVVDSAKSTNSAGPWLHAVQVNAAFYHSLAIDSDGIARAWGNNNTGQLGNPDAGSQSLFPVPVAFNLQPVITGAIFDTSPGTNLNPVSNSNSVTVLTPPHQPGPVTVSVDYTLGGKAQSPVTSLSYTYTPTGVLPRAGGEGVILSLAASMTSMGGVLASRRHRRETQRFLHTSHE